MGDLLQRFRRTTREPELTPTTGTAGCAPGRLATLNTSIRNEGIAAQALNDFATPARPTRSSSNGSDTPIPPNVFSPGPRLRRQRSGDDLFSHQERKRLKSHAHTQCEKFGLAKDSLDSFCEVYIFFLPGFTSLTNTYHRARMPSTCLSV
jgi:hypothetical protein